MRKWLIVEGGRRGSWVDLLQTWPLDISAVFVVSGLQQHPTILFHSRSSTRTEVFGWPIRIQKRILRNKIHMLNSTWHQNQGISSQSGCSAASSKLEVSWWLNVNFKNPSQRFFFFINVFSCHYRGNSRHNMLQYSSRSTLRATPELCRFFLASTVVWKPCQWWSNVAFMWCFSSSPLIRLEINNAYATLMLSFFLCWVNFSSSPFSLSREQQRWATALQRSEMIKTALPGRRLPSSPAVLKQYPWRCVTQFICWKQLLTTTCAQRSYAEWLLKLSSSEPSSASWAATPLMAHNTLSDAVEGQLPRPHDEYTLTISFI